MKRCYLVINSLPFMKVHICQEEDHGLFNLALQEQLLPEPMRS